MDFDLTSRQLWRAMRTERRFQTLRSSGTSKPIQFSPGPRLLRRPGMPGGYIKSVGLSETVGRNGTASSAMISDDFSKAIAEACLVWRPGYLEAPTSMATKSGNLN